LNFRTFPESEISGYGKRFQNSLSGHEEETDVKTLGKKVEKVISEFSKSTGKKFELWFEPGNFLSEKADIYW
jgi:diaminopimelate decarboxylase